MLVRSNINTITTLTKAAAGSVLVRSGATAVLASGGVALFVGRPDGTLLVYDYTGEGFNPAIVVPEVKSDLANVRFLGTDARQEIDLFGQGEKLVAATPCSP